MIIYRQPISFLVFSNAPACELVPTAFSAFADRFARLICTSNANAYTSSGVAGATISFSCDKEPCEGGDGITTTDSHYSVAASFGAQLMFGLSGESSRYSAIVLSNQNGLW